MKGASRGVLEAGQSARRGAIRTARSADRGAPWSVDEASRAMCQSATAEADGVKWGKDMRAQLKTMQRDVDSLTDHASYLSNKITFVLDAMLGVVNLEQNNIIKLFSVMAVVLMPPTLIASIYGMNFKIMPELEPQIRSAPNGSK
jgi:Mg2+ and Co2+ transporter CorA